MRFLYYTNKPADAKKIEAEMRASSFLREDDSVWFLPTSGEEYITVVEG